VYHWTQRPALHKRPLSPREKGARSASTGPQRTRSTTSFSNTPAHRSLCDPFVGQIYTLSCSVRDGRNCRLAIHLSLQRPQARHHREDI
jgi:hypothetical protein